MEEYMPAGAPAPEDAYRPEDEYASIDEPITSADTSAPAEQSAEQPAEPKRTAAPRPAPPVYPGYPQPAPPMYSHPAYPGYYPYPMPMQQPYPAPMQQPYPAPMQQPYPAPAQPYAPPIPSYYAQPQGYYPPTPPVYHQAPRQPITNVPAPPAPPAPPRQPRAHSENPYAAPAPAPAPVPTSAYGAAPAAPTAAPAPKPPTSTGTKVFLIILIALLAGLIIGFSVYIAHLADNEKKSDSSNSGSGVTVPDDYDNYFKDLEPDSDPQSSGYEEITREITLVEDKGDTQKRDDDNKETVGEPDPNAKSITLNPMPKDKDDAKYTTQSAYDAVSDSVVTVELYEDKISDNINDIKGSGTGTIISEDGYIITNAHVVRNSRHYIVKISLNSGETYQAKVIGYDTWTDLAVLKVDAKGLKPVTFGDSDLIEIGQDVIAIGSPGGEKFKNSLTKGIVSAVDRELTINKYVKYIQSDAAISPGNSGGPLCNIYGQVIGINTAKTTATNYEAMTFSIPSDTVKEIVTELLHYGYVRGRTRVGFTGSEISAEEQYYYGYPAGIVISAVDPEGALAGVDIKEGDIITAIDGDEVTSFQDIYAVLNRHKPGDKVEVKLSRPKQD